jgi:uncharacterized membrane protein
VLAAPIPRRSPVQALSGKTTTPSKLGEQVLALPTIEAPPRNRALPDPIHLTRSLIKADELVRKREQQLSSAIIARSELSARLLQFAPSEEAALDAITDRLIDHLSSAPSSCAEERRLQARSAAQQTRARERFEAALAAFSSAVPDRSTSPIAACDRPDPKSLERWRRRVERDLVRASGLSQEGGREVFEALSRQVRSELLGDDPAMKAEDPSFKDRLLARISGVLQSAHSFLRRVADGLTMHASSGSKAEESLGDRLADMVAKFGGSWKFIALSIVGIAAWGLLNTVFHMTFDPYPFIFLNLVLSCVAALQAPVILMSQNRQEEKDRTRAEEDFRIDREAERQVRELRREVHGLAAGFDAKLEAILREVRSARTCETSASS